MPPNPLTLKGPSRIALRAAVAGLALCAAAVPAAERIAPYSCRNGLFPAEQGALRVTKFTAGKDDKLYFYADDKGCPADEAKCRTKAYVLPGDELLVNQRVSGWACAWFQGRKRESVGWVKSDNLADQPAEQDSPQRWLGKWLFYSNAITITKQGDALRVKGSALWQGGRSAAGYPVVHTGELEGSIHPAQGRAQHASGTHEYDCTADFVRLGKYLVVQDNGSCGGMNVRFNGVYTKKR